MFSLPLPGRSVTTADELARERDGSFRPDIEGLRGVAVALVLLFHAGLGFGGGFIGVDVFFVISGFLITGLLIRERERTGRTDFVRFYARRIRRLLPAALVVIVTTVAVITPLTYVADQPKTLLDAAAVSLSIGNMRFAMVDADYFGASNGPSAFLQFWSLAVEEQFYLVWPALLALVAMSRLLRERLWLVFGAVFIVSLVAYMGMTVISINYAFYSLPTRAWELSLGALLVLAYRRWPAIDDGILRRTAVRLTPLVGWLALGVIVLTGAFFSEARAATAPMVVAAVIAAGTLIAAGQHRTGPGILLRTAPARYVGKISYSLYLWHWPIVVTLPLLLSAGGPASPVVKLGLLVVSIVVADLSWRFIETPFRTNRVTWTARRTLVGGLVALSVVALVTGGIGWYRGSEREARFVALEQTPIDWARTTMATSSAGPIALPSDVRPPLDLVSLDYPRYQQLGVPNSDFRVAVVGDSHAQSLIPAIEQVALRRGWSVDPYIRYGCPLTDLALRNGANKLEDVECEAFGADTVAHLSADPYDLVIVSMNRFTYSPLHDEDKTVERKAAGLAHRLEQLSQASPTVLIFDTPGPVASTPTCLRTHEDDISACVDDEAVAFRGDFGAVQRRAVELSGVAAIDLSDSLCPDGSCPAVIEDVIVYRDTGHLSATFSRALAPILDAELTKALGSARD